MTEGFFKLFISIAIPVSGAIGYVHGTFATISRVEKIESKVTTFKKAVLRSDNLICKMAIRQKLEDAEQICTE